MTKSFVAGVEALLTKIAAERGVVTGAERGELYKHFGKKPGCSLGRDKDGFYVYTHRARSKSFPRPSAIPKDKIKFVDSTTG